MQKTSNNILRYQTKLRYLPHTIRKSAYTKSFKCILNNNLKKPPVVNIGLSEGGKIFSSMDHILFFCVTITKVEQIWQTVIQIHSNYKYFKTKCLFVYGTMVCRGNLRTNTSTSRPRYNTHGQWCICNVQVQQVLMWQFTILCSINTVPVIALVQTAGNFITYTQIGNPLGSPLALTTYNYKTNLIMCYYKCRIIDFQHLHDFLDG